MEFSEKYKHIGYSYANGVPTGWVSIVEKMIIDLEKQMWPRWIPMFLKRLIHYLATGNSCVRIKYHWAYKLRNRIAHHRQINDIKEKYATLRVYGYGIDGDIVKLAIKECRETCQFCGSKKNVDFIDTGWVYLLCQECVDTNPEFSPTRKVLIEKI